MTQFPEDLETIIFRLSDDGWTEKSYVYADGVFNVVMVKEDMTVRIELEEEK